MNVKEMIEELQKCPPDKEVMFADFIPVRQVIDDDEQVFITDAECCPVLDVDEQMHEQQELDAEYAEVQAEMYEGLLGGF